MTLPTSLQAPTTPPPVLPRQSMARVQSRGRRLADPDAGAPAGRSGVGLIHHNAVTVDGTVMVPVHTGGASESSYMDVPHDETAARSAYPHRSCIDIAMFPGARRAA